MALIFFSFVKLWIQSLLAGAKIGILDMIRMKLLNIDYRRHVELEAMPGAAAPAAATVEFQAQIQVLAEPRLLIGPAGDLRLIDLELAHLLSDGPPLSWGAATPGFASPEQLAARPSTFSDDYYALGATIAYMATASVPYLLPDRGQPRSLSERLRDWIAGAESDGAVAARVCDLVLGCMADDPSQRWGPREVLTAMEQPRPSSCRHEVTTVSAAELAAAVEDMGHWLARTIDPSGQRLWPTTCLGQADDPINVQSGAGGVGLFLCRAIEAGGDPALRDLVATTSRWVSSVVSADPNRPPGLYFGLAGATRAVGAAAV